MKSSELTDKAARELLAANKTETFNFRFAISEVGTVASRKTFSGSLLGGLILLKLKYDLLHFKNPETKWLKCVKA
tara:strand:- start:2884 stop:3108 length:225 start_codon:yes stop_codon:yes gene_type:complete